MTETGTGTRIESTSVLSPALTRRIDALAHAATHADGVPPLSDHALVHVRNGGAGVLHVLMWAGHELAAYAQLDSSDAISGAQAELAVDPAYRGAGHARTLVRELVRASPDERLQLWAHGERPDARRLAEGMGFTRTRVLAQMGRPLDASFAAPELPAGATLREFIPGRDEAALLAVNNAAFAGHPDQGDWQEEDLLGREREPWFDPAGLFLLDLDGQPAGFVWTKVHGSERSGHTHEQVGEIYVLGVAPGAVRRGLGKLLASAGLAHLVARGLSEVILYVDESNAAAVALYEQLGFTRRGVDALFSLQPR